MMNGQTAPRLASALSWAFLLGVLGWVFLRWLRQGARAVAFPFELDYGEGIIWEQARLLFSHAAYAPIDQFPALVFHYPPVFHAASVALSRLSGADMLAAGRALSMLSTVGLAALAGLLVGDVMDRNSGRGARVMAGLAATLLVFACMPVMLWTPLMRVDMMASLFAFLGIALGLRALRHAWLIYPAGASFVLAVYTKQISIAAPLALFPVLLWLRPGLAVRGLSVCLIVGGAALAGLDWATSGGFVRHIFLYNVNRLNVGGLGWLVVVLYYHAAYFVVALPVLFKLPALAFRYAGLHRNQREVAVIADPRQASMLVLGLYWVWATLMTLAVAKSGASVNYLIEWMCVTSVLAGLALSRAAQFVTGRLDTTRAPFYATCIVPLALGLQVAALHAFVPMSYDRAWTPERMAENEELSARIRAADKPIISDNMVLLVRNQRPVLWEPAIFAELASVGIWDEEALVSRIRSGEFAMFITVGTRGTSVFDSRYNPQVADAMDDVYPVQEPLGAYTLHLPAN